MSTLVPPARRTWRIPRLPLEDWTFITLWGWGGLLALMVAIAVGMDRWNQITSFFGRETGEVTVTSSVWAPLAALTVWYAGFVAGYYMHYYLPSFVAAGRTRRDSAIEAGIFGGILVVLLAVLITIGFVIERAVFAIGGWPRGVPEHEVYGSYDDYGIIFLVFFSTLAMWTAGGAMLGSAFYRNTSRGLVCLVIAIAGISLASPFVFVFDRLTRTDDTTTQIILPLLAAVVLAGLTWWNARDVPVRNK